jgi:hypothetical protein
MFSHATLRHFITPLLPCHATPGHILGHSADIFAISHYADIATLYFRCFFQPPAIDIDIIFRYFIDIIIDMPLILS